MSEYQEFTGKTVEEAIRAAREAFGVSGLDDLDFEILTPGSRGVLGMGAEPARIVAAPRAALGGAAPRREAASSQPLPPAPDRPPRERYDRGPREGDRGDRGGRDRFGDRGPRPEGGERERFGDRGPRREGGDRPPRQDRPDRADRPDRFGDRDHAPASAPESEARVGAGAEDVPSMLESQVETFEASPRPERAPEDRRPQREGRGPSRGTGRPAGEARPDRGDRGDRGERGDRSRALSTQEEDQIRTARASLGHEREEVQAAEASPEALEAARQILQELMRLMGYEATVAIKSGATSKLDVTGGESDREALGALIGRKGERLSALQHLVNLMLSKQMGSWTRVLVDVEDYRGRRERQLEELARRAAARVVETGKMLQLEPMPALERRWVHLSLREHPDVMTQSIGEEPNRRVVVLRRT
jgi:predicted RNA-binding protein Jag